MLSRSQIKGRIRSRSLNERRLRAAVEQARWSEVSESHASKSCTYSEFPICLKDGEIPPDTSGRRSLLCSYVTGAGSSKINWTSHRAVVREQTSLG